MENSYKINIKLIKWPVDIKKESSPIAVRLTDCKLLRINVYEFLNNILPSIYNKRVLEIGPRTLQQHAELNATFNDLDYTWIDTRKILESQENKYISCDLNPEIGADYNCDVIDLLNILGSNSLDVIIACEVLEHSPKFWELPRIFYELLDTKGELYLTIPFYCRHHDPKPDYWRFTEDGLILLFNKMFDIELTKLLWKADDGQTPVHITIKGIKR
jgi:hypothetical protein